MRDSYDVKSLEDQVFGTAEEEPGMDEDMELWENPRPVKIEAILEDGTQAEYMAVGVFLEGEKEYIALETEDGDIQLMELGREEEDDIRLIPIEDEEEQERVLDAFHYYFEEPGIESQEPEDGPAEPEDEFTEPEDGSEEPENESERGNEDDRAENREED